MTIFSTVMRLGSLTAAATSLGIAQPSVSKSIALMEHRLGLRLFERVRGRLVPTAEAGLILGEALRIEEELSRFDRYLDDVRHLRAGQLRVAATPALALNFLPLVARKFRQQLPSYGLSLDMHLNHEIAGLVERGQYDIGLAVIPSADEREDLMVLRRGRIVCVLPQAHPLATSPAVHWEDIDPAELIYITTDARLVMLLSAGIPGFLHHRQSATETNRYSIAVRLVRQGMGITLVDEFTIIDAEAEGLTMRPFEPELKVSLVMALDSKRVARKALNEFTTSIHLTLDEELGSPRG
ncbi:LysR substrate-binding domain-containing protein [Ancylobacter sp. MQZ15Z-1]|uniref:LysR substrate-binding domain-containing protein n=1 Tax=Ancylobacter mangrovi TaxID=2972472 RepID=A0A9X2PFG3_9HYPH|nr:LysR substrate-binding domain-containing protein [Ancylobacter mangrovi]MCS0497772.1 LysR substrate-binding domain-containing protein [Ancylobacter mangrovi]